MSNIEVEVTGAWIGGDWTVGVGYDDASGPSAVVHGAWIRPVQQGSSMNRVLSVSRRLGVAAVVALSILAGPLLAQTPMPSQEQVEILRNMSPEQRDLLLEQLGKESQGGSDSSSSTDRNASRDRNGNARRQGERTDERKPGDDPRRRRRARRRRPTMASGPPRRGQLQAGRHAADRHRPAQAADDRAAGFAAGHARRSPSPSIRRWTSRRRTSSRGSSSLIRSRNPYQLDRSGALQLPGYPGIPLAGLSEEQATLLLSAEATFRRLEIGVTRLPLLERGVARLKPFGYDLFDEAPSTFAPVTDVPVPADYIVGPGDQLTVQLYGNQNRTLRLIVGRDGRVNFPELGPIAVGGQRFESVRSSLEGRVERQMLGVRASVSVGDTRSIRVFVLGEANRPGSYTVSGLGTVTSALFASGGVKTIGSLRDIQLKRRGAVVRRIDLYDLLLRGDTSGDTTLLPGDVIFIPPVGATVAVDGEVRRPGIYELRGECRGGRRRAARGRAHVRGRRPARDAVARRRAGAAPDRRRQPRARPRAAPACCAMATCCASHASRPQLDSGVQVSGHVHTPGAVAWRQGLRISDVLPSVDDLKPNADLGYILIRRELPPDRRIVVLSADLSRALRDRGGEADVRLSPRDQIMVFDLESGREREIQRLLEELRLQARIDRPTGIVRVGGRVRVPGEYPLEPNMTVAALIRAGGNLSDAAYGGKAELTRYTVVDGEARRTELLEIDLAKVLMGDKEADVALRPFDFLNIKEIPEWAVQEQVTLLGEVKFPGNYPIKRGETLKSVLARAGGLTELAFPEGGVFTRKDLREREQAQLDVLAGRLQKDLATMALQASAANQASASQAAAVGQTLLSQIKASKAVGRLVIDIDRAMLDDSATSALVLQNGDTLLIPKRSQEVTVIGEVQNATSHLYRSGLARDDYIGLSGGATRKADAKRTYIVRANGSVVSAENSRWFARGTQVAIKPGDTVVVPLDTERLPTLPLWQAVTQIVYNLAIAAAAINSF